MLIICISFIGEAGVGDCVRDWILAAINHNHVARSRRRNGRFMSRIFSTKGSTNTHIRGWAGNWTCMALFE